MGFMQSRVLAFINNIHTQSCTYTRRVHAQQPTI